MSSSTPGMFISQQQAAALLPLIQQIAAGVPPTCTSPSPISKSTSESDPSPFLVPNNTPLNTSASGYATDTSVGSEASRFSSEELLQSKQNYRANKH